MATKRSFADLTHLSDAEIQTVLHANKLGYHDLVSLSDPKIQALLRAVDQKDLVVAFSAAGAELKQKLMNQMPEKVRILMAKEMKAVGSLSKETIQAAQQRLLQQAAQLGKQGKIAWPPGAWKKEDAKRAQNVQHVITRYHRAIREKDVDAALDCLSKNYFTAGRRDGAVGDPTRWGVGSQPPKAFFRKWVSQGSYACAIKFLHTSIDGNVAMAVTSETGHAKPLGGERFSWKGVTNLWFLAKAKAEWKIVSSIHGIGE